MYKNTESTDAKEQPTAKQEKTTVQGYNEWVVETVAFGLICWDMTLINQPR